MSYVNKGTSAPTVIVSLAPDFSGNYVCDATVEAHDVTIQRAIDYIGVFGRGTVFIRQGQYDITAPLDISGIYAITIEGEGRGRPLNYTGGGVVQEGTILVLANGTDNHMLQMIEGAPAKACAVKISRLNFDGNNTNQTPAAAGDIIHFEYVKEAAIENCTLMRAIRDCVQIISSGENNWITNNVIYQDGNGRHCIYQSQSSGSKIFGNMIFGASAASAVGIRLFNNSSYNLIMENTITDCYLNVEVERSSYNLINDNQIADTSDTHNITLTDTCLHNTISNNRITNAVFHGVNITDYGTACEFNKVIENQILNNGIDGIEVSALTETTEIFNNTIRGNAAYGVDVAAGTVLNTWVKNNRFDTNATAAIRDLGTDTAVHEEFVYVTDSDSNIGDHPVLVLPDTVDTTLRFQIHIPLEFQQTVTAQAIVLQTATAAGPPNMQWSTTTDWGKLCAGENYNAGSDAETDQTTAVAQNNLVCIDVSASLTGIAAGDLVGFTFIRRASQAGDTINADAYFLGFRLRYV